MQPGEMMGVKQIVTSQYQGPIPSSFEMGNYDRILPGAAERILAMAEREQLHRHTIEDDANLANITLAKNSLWIRAGAQIGAFLLFLTSLSAAVYFAVLGHVWLSGTVFTGVLTILAGAFVFVRRAKKKKSGPPKKK